MNLNDDQMLVRARVLIDKYTRPDPPQTLTEGSEPDFMAVWQWALNTERLDIIAPLARTACVRIMHNTSERYETMYLLRRFAEKAKSSGRIQEYAHLLMALAELDDDPAHKTPWY